MNMVTFSIRMKLLTSVFCLTLLLRMSNCFPLEQVQMENSENFHLANTCLRITLNGIRDDRSPVLILHGFTGFKEMYMDLLQVIALRTARRVCIADLRNHGDSPRSEKTDSKVMAADVNLLMKTLDTDKLVILGHSMGGKVAVELALTYPDKVEKIIVEDMRPNGLSEEVLKQMFQGSLNSYRNALNLIPRNSTEREAKKVIAEYFKNLFKSMNETLDFDDRLIDYIPIKCPEGKCKWKTNLDVLDKIQKDPLKYWTSNSGKSETPALFIYGEKSPFRVAEAKDEILELFPKAQLYAVKGGRHILNGYNDYRNEVINFINALQ